MASHRRDAAYLHERGDCAYAKSAGRAHYEVLGGVRDGWQLCVPEAEVAEFRRGDVIAMLGECFVVEQLRSGVYALRSGAMTGLRGDQKPRRTDGEIW